MSLAIDRSMRFFGMVGRGWTTHRLHFCRGVPGEKCRDYDTKQPDNEDPVILEIWGMRCTPSLQSLLGLLWRRLVTPERVLSMRQIELLDIKTVSKQMTYAKLNCLII